jgi:pimeloyl-ACP methyl ester carboxylesterase
MLTGGKCDRVEPFTIHLEPATLDDLRARLGRTRWPPAAELGELKALISHWRDGFDWRAHERELNRFAQVRLEVDGVRVHAIVERGRGPRPLPLLLTHGWPSTFAEFRHVIGPLSDSAAFGGDPADAFDVVVPSLPGFGFSEPLPGGDFARVPALWVRLMERLGHERFGAHGGDIGGFVTNRLGAEFPGRLVGIHVHYPAEPRVDGDLSAEEREFLAARPGQRESGAAYAHVHRTRPLVLASGLADSPAGLAAWIADKWWEWSDRVDREELLTALTIYWATGTIASSLAPYREWGLGAPPEADLYPLRPAGVEPRPLEAPIEVPAGIALFHVRYPRRFAQRAYADLRRWTEMQGQGHFPALEHPDELVEDLREFFRPLRAQA